MSASRLCITAVLAFLAACTQGPPVEIASPPAGQTATGPAAAPRLVEAGKNTGTFSGQIALLAKDGSQIDSVPLVLNSVSGASEPIGTLEPVPYLAQTATPFPGGGVERNVSVNYVQIGFTVTRLSTSPQADGAVYEVWYGRLPPGSVPDDGVINGRPVVLTYTKTVTVPFDGVARNVRLMPKDGAPPDLAPEIRYGAEPMKRFTVVQ